MILSILIPTIPKRSGLLSVLLQELYRQIGNKPIEVLVHKGEGTTGAKRNELVQSAKGEYVCFIDDDDAVSHQYIDLIIAALASKPDCLSLNGLMTTNGRHPHKFIHSLKFSAYFEQDKVYYRPPNHLNVMRRSIAEQFPFPDKTFGEDTAWAMDICAAQALKTEVEINEILYYYQYKSNK
jgi:glycosyltransferase involved in cell wall biosynthesis